MNPSSAVGGEKKANTGSFARLSRLQQEGRVRRVTFGYRMVPLRKTFSVVLSNVWRTGDQKLRGALVGGGL